MVSRGLGGGVAVVLEGFYFLSFGGFYFQFSLLRERGIGGTVILLFYYSTILIDAHVTQWWVDGRGAPLG